MRQPATTSRRKRGPPKQKIEAIGAFELTPLDLMLAVMRNPKLKAAVRLEAAKSAAAYADPPLAPIATDVTRLVGQLLAEIVKSDAGPAKH
jgi:hypothetical protein